MDYVCRGGVIAIHPEEARKGLNQRMQANAENMSVCTVSMYSASVQFLDGEEEEEENSVLYGVHTYQLPHAELLRNLFPLCRCRSGGP